MLPSKCTWCGCSMQVNQAEWANPDAHMCVNCVSAINAMTSSIPDPDDEFELITEEEEELLNDWDMLDDDFIYEDLPSLDSPSCECGAEKINSPWHSRWCPIFKDPF